MTTEIAVAKSTVADGPDEADKLVTGAVSLSTKENGSGDMDCDRMAVDARGNLMLLSVLGEVHRIKAAHAMLHNTGRTRVYAHYVVLRQPGHYGTKRARDINISAHEDGYARYVHKVGYGLAHAIWVARAEGFLPVIDDEALWQELKDTRFTTPLLREWMPYVRERLASGDLLRYCLGFRAECAVLNCNTEHLDKIVQEGVESRAIEIPRPGVVDTTLADSRVLEDTREIKVK